MNRSTIDTSEQQDASPQLDITEFDKLRHQSMMTARHHDDDRATLERRKRLDQMRSSHFNTLAPPPPKNHSNHADLDSDDEGSLDGSIWMDTGRKLFGSSSKKNRNSSIDMDASFSSLFSGRIFAFGGGSSNNKSGAVRTTEEDGSESSLEDDLFAKDAQANQSSSSSSLNSRFLGKFVVQRRKSTISKSNTNESSQEVDKREMVKRREAADEMLKGNLSAAELPPHVATREENIGSSCQKHHKKDNHDSQRCRSRRQSMRKAESQRPPRRRRASVGPAEKRSSHRRSSLVPSSSHEETPVPTSTRVESSRSHRVSRRGSLAHSSRGTDDSQRQRASSVGGGSKTEAQFTT